MLRSSRLVVLLISCLHCHSMTALLLKIFMLLRLTFLLNDYLSFPALVFIPFSD
jgi:hypothetical protein